MDRHLLERPGPIMIKAQGQFLSLIYMHIICEVLPHYTSGDCKRFQEYLNYCQKGFMPSTY